MREHRWWGGAGREGQPVPSPPSAMGGTPGLGQARVRVMVALYVWAAADAGTPSDNTAPHENVPPLRELVVVHRDCGELRRPTVVVDPGSTSATSPGTTSWATAAIGSQPRLSPGMHR